MVQFEYDAIMKRYNVKVPWQLGDGSDQVIVGSISKDNRMTVHGELSLHMLKQIIMHWDEYEHMEERREKREKEYVRCELKHDLSKSVDELDFTVRTHNCLQSRGIRTIGELVEKSERDIRRIKNCGRKSLTEIEVKLDELGLTLKQ
jgi:DNA-directed RNA polymerase subunit alpha